MAKRNNTKYNVEGLGENLNKRKLVFTIVKDWVEKNKPSLEELQKVFPDEVQGSNGVVKKEAEIKDPKRYNVKEPLKIKNGAHIVVCNQWGDNIDSFINASEQLGYEITKTEEPKLDKIIDLTDFEPFKLSEQFKSHLDNDDMCNSINEELEALIDEDPKFMAYAKVFENISGFQFSDYNEDVEDYFTIANGPFPLLKALQEQSLISRILEKHNIKESEVSSTNTNFKLLFTGYFCTAIEILTFPEEEEIVAEFIFAQSCTAEDLELDDGGDWLADLTLDILNHIYHKNVQAVDYEDGCTLQGSYFGDPVDSGYDYLKVSRELIDQMYS